MASNLFSLSQVQAINVIELALPTSMDTADFDKLSDSLLAVLDGKAAERWVLDLSKASYMGSAMLGLMVNIRQRVKQGDGRLVLCGLSNRLLEIFRTCCMERLFVIARTRGEAMSVAAKS